MGWRASRLTILSVVIGLTLSCSQSQESLSGNTVSCEAMAELAVPDIRWIKAERHSLTSSDSQAVQSSSSVCRLTLEASPVRKSTIGIEIWLPETQWNGKLQMVGNGGYSSRINIAAFERLVRNGYAVVGTDTGHKGDDPAFAQGRPEAISDWAHRAVHVSVVQAKRLVEAFYGAPAQHSYFSGCSTGGHQGLMAAQRYPHDFDGIIVGAPGHNRTHLNAGFLWQFVQNRHPNDPTKALLSSDQLSLISTAVLEQCRVNNGAVSGGLPEDPFLNNPYHCDFDPAALACAGKQQNGADCLNNDQIQALGQMYAGAHNPETGERIYFGFLPGTEAAGGYGDKVGWSLYWADPADPAAPARESFWQYWAFPETPWNWQNFDFNDDMKKADDRLAREVNAMDANLTEFFNRGGKLLHFHGMNDPVVPVTDSISYYRRVLAATDAARPSTLAEHYQLYLMPGVNHCAGGEGPGEVDFQTALEQWVEQGHSPERLIATGTATLGAASDASYERPLCPYPTFAYYDGKGDPRAAESFICRRSSRDFNIPDVAEDYLR